MKDNNRGLTFWNAVAFAGALGAVPAAVGAFAYWLLRFGYGNPFLIAVEGGVTAGLLSLLDAYPVERTFRESREVIHDGATADDTLKLLSKLAAKYCLVLLAIVLFFEWAYAKMPLRLSLLTCAAAGVVVYGLYSRFQNESVFVKGREVISFGEARRRARSRRKLFEPTFELVPGLHLRERAKQYGIAFIGASRTGKTTLVRLDMQQSFCPRRTLLDELLGRPRRRCRGLVYDGKADLLPVLSGMRPSCDILSFNLFDDPTKSHPERRVYRSVRWAIAEDVIDPATAETFAPVFVPTDTGNLKDPFWVMAATHVVSGVMMALHAKKPLKWTLADFVRVFEYKEDVLSILDTSDYSRQCMSFLKSKGVSSDDVLKTLMNYIRQLRTLSAAAERSEHPGVSLRKWAAGEGIIVLPVDERVRTPLDTYYRVIFTAIVQMMLAPDQEKNGVTDIFLDEIREAGYLPPLNSLLCRGFGKNAVVRLAYQSQAGMSDAQGSRDLSAEILGLCQNLVVCELSEGETATTISEQWGDHDVYRTTEAGTRRRETHRALFPPEFARLQPADLYQGMSAFVTSPELTGAVTKFEISGRLFSLLTPVDDIPAVSKVLEANQYLPKWTEDEREALGLPRKEPTAEAGTKEAPFTVTEKSKAANDQDNLFPFSSTSRRRREREQGL